MSSHIVTFTKGSDPGQYRVRLQDPQAADAEGYEVPVTRKGGSTETVKLTKLVFVGVDDRDFPDRPASGLPVALYEFERIRSGEPFVY